MILWLFSLPFASAADCEPLGEAMEDARRRLVEEADLQGSEEAVERATESLDCGDPISATELAWYWVVRGAGEVSTGRVAEGTARMGAARRIAPGVWEPTLGAELKSVWMQAEPSGPAGVLTTAPAVDAPVFVDGSELTLPASVEPGLHLLQIVVDDHVVWGREAYVPAGQALTVDVSGARLPAPSVAPAVAPVASTPEKPRVLRIHVGTGAALQAGPTFAPEDESIETGLKAAVPAEVGLEAATGKVRVRGALRGALLVAGRYAYASATGDTMVIRSSIGGNAGVMVGSTHAFGGLVSLAVPGRLGAQGVWRWAAIGPNGALEVRPGVNLLTGGRAPEAQLDTMLTWSL